MNDAVITLTNKFRAGHVFEYFSKSLGGPIRRSIVNDDQFKV
jgi:hypothetical protein